MNIMYASMTGNVKRFVEKLNYEAYDIETVGKVTKPFILVTYTIGFGGVPESVAEFLEDNHEFMRGVIVSGDKVWGNNFGMAGDTISREYGVPLIRKIEKSGMESDVLTIRTIIGTMKTESGRY